MTTKLQVLVDLCWFDGSNEDGKW